MYKYVSLKDIVENENYPFNKGQMNYFILKRRQNGLLNAVRQIGNRIYIRLDLFNEWLESHASKSLEKEDDESDPLDAPIDDLGFLIRSYHGLKRNKIKTIRELLTYSKEDLINFRNMGKKCIIDIENKLAERKLHLKKE